MIITFCILATIIIFITSHWVKIPDDAGATLFIKVILTLIGVLGVACFVWGVQHANLLI